MIFGFNTDVKQSGTVYHVQSEARTGEQLLQTQFFVKGRCIGKRATSYAENSRQPDFSEKQMEEMLREQHKLVLDSVKKGTLDSVIVKVEVPATKPAALKLEWLDAGSVRMNGDLVMRISVTQNNVAIAGARVTSRLSPVNGAPLYSQAITDANGSTELKVTMPPEGGEGSALLLQATHDGQMVTRKFRLHRQN